MKFTIPYGALHISQRCSRLRISVSRIVSPIAPGAKAISGSLDSLYGSVTPSGSTYKGYHYMTWYVGNAKHAASYYITLFGFRVIAYQGLETGTFEHSFLPQL